MIDLFLSLAALVPRWLATRSLGEKVEAAGRGRQSRRPHRDWRSAGENDRAGGALSSQCILRKKRLV
jgi:hypothetical protein